MPPKFAQDYQQRERSSNPDVPLQPFALSAAEAAYKVNHALPHRSTYQSFAKTQNSSSTATASSNSNSNAPFLPYRQRLLAAALANSNVEDPLSSNDSSSAPSSNAVSSNTGNSGSASASRSSPSMSKGKSKDTIQGHASSGRPTENVLSSSANPAEFDPDATYYDLLMTHAAASLPEPGPSHFERRRALWTAIPPEPMVSTTPSPSRVKLEALLGQPGAVESDEVWRAGLKNVWKGLVGGNQLRQRLPLAIVLKILQAGWLRDGTWPEGLVAPAWGDEQQQADPSPEPPYATSNPTAPRTQDQRDRDDRRHTHEEEAYAAAIRASADHASGSIQMHPYAQMHIMGMGMNMGIPPGYSPSSGDAPEESYYGMPYAYAEATPPPEDAEVGMPAGLEIPPLPMSGCQGGRPAVESDMDTDEEGEPGDMEVEVNAGDGRHEGG